MILVVQTQDSRRNLEEEMSETLRYPLDAHLSYIKHGVEAIIDDEVTKRFSAAELKVRPPVTVCQSVRC